MIGAIGYVGPELKPRQKAAIIVRYLLAEGADLDLSALPQPAQAALAEEMAHMSLIDRATRDLVVEEFCAQIESVGLSFPGGITGTLDLLQGHLSDGAAARLRRAAVLTGASDPWAQITALPSSTLAELARTEAVEVAAVLLSRLPAPRAAEVFGLTDPETARQIAYAMSLVGPIADEALRRIGLALIHAADSMPPPQTDGGPVEKVGAILNYSQASMRDSVLAGLESDDAGFAENVRKTIFTWANIPTRVDPRDIPRLTREVEGVTLIKALAGATGKDAAAADFILSNLSTRLADSMREEIAELGKVSARDAEEAMGVVVAAIRQMEANGDLFLIAPDAEGED